MLEFIEGALTAGAIALTVRGMLAIRRTKQAGLPPGVYSRWYYDFDGDLMCPECRSSYIFSSQLSKRCECAEFWEAHRHFNCHSCGLKGIIQTRRATLK